MTTINLDNADSITGQVRSIALLDASGNHNAYIDEPLTADRASALALLYSNGEATVGDANAVGTHLYALSRGPQVTLCELQRTLNSDVLKRCGIQLRVEFGLYSTGHGDLEPWHAVLLVMTGWTQAQPF